MTSREQIVERMRSKAGIVDAHTHVGLSYKSYVNYSYPYCLSFEDLVIRMKHHGISHSIVFPYDSSYYVVEAGGSEVVKTTEEFAAFPYQIANQNLFREVYEIFPEYSEMALPFARFDPSRKTQEQVDLLEKLYDSYPMFGLKTVTTYIQAYVNDLATVGKPILDFAVSHDLPITFHSSYYKQDPWASVYDIVRFAEGHPELRVCIAHSARFVQSVLERAASLSNCFVDLSAFDIHCLLARKNSHSIPPKEQRFDADYTDPSSVMKKLVSAYPDTIIWGSDTPANYYIKSYHDAAGNLLHSSLKSSFDTEIEILRDLSCSAMERISHTNTLAYLFG